MIFISYDDFKRLVEACESKREEYLALSRVIFQFAMEEGTEMRYAFPVSEKLMPSELVLTPSAILNKEKTMPEKINAIKLSGRIVIRSIEADPDMAGTLEADVVGKHHFELVNGMAMVPTEEDVWTDEKMKKAIENYTILYSYLKAVFEKGYATVTIENPQSDEFDIFAKDIIPTVLKSIEPDKPVISGSTAGISGSTVSMSGSTANISERDTLLNQTIENPRIKALINLTKGKSLKDIKLTCCIIKMAYDYGTLTDEEYIKALHLDESVEGIYFAADVTNKDARNVLVNAIAEIQNLAKGQKSAFVDKVAGYCTLKGINDVSMIMPKFLVSTDIIKDFEKLITECVPTINEKISANEKKELADSYKPNDIEKAIEKAGDDAELLDKEEKEKKPSPESEPVPVPDSPRPRPHFEPHPGRQRSEPENRPMVRNPDRYEQWKREQERRRHHLDIPPNDDDNSGNPFE